MSPTQNIYTLDSEGVKLGDGHIPCLIFFNNIGRAVCWAQPSITGGRYPTERPSAPRGHTESTQG